MWSSLGEILTNVLHSEQREFASSQGKKEVSSDLTLDCEEYLCLGVCIIQQNKNRSKWIFFPPFQNNTPVSVAFIPLMGPVPSQLSRGGNASVHPLDFSIQTVAQLCSFHFALINFALSPPLCFILMLT